MKMNFSFLLYFVDFCSMLLNILSSLPIELDIPHQTFLDQPTLSSLQAVVYGRMSCVFQLG